jgi:hypothetical protein
MLTRPEPHVAPNGTVAGSVPGDAVGDLERGQFFDQIPAAITTTSTLASDRATGKCGSESVSGLPPANGYRKQESSR